MVETDDARDFFDQVFFDLQVKPVGRRLHRDDSGLLLRLQAQTGQGLHALRRTQRHADHLDRTRHPQLHRAGLRHGGLLVVDRAKGGIWRATNFGNQLADALDVRHRQGRIDATLKTVSGVGGKIEAARTSGHCRRPPKSGLDINMAGGIAHCGGVTTHDAGQRFDLLVVGNHANLGIQRNGVAVEQLQLLAGTGPAHLQTTVDFFQIKDVGRATQLKHDVVGDVYQRADAALPATRQTVHHPRGRLRLRIDVAHDASGKAATQVRGSNVHRQDFGQTDRHGRNRRHFQRRACQRSHLARHAQYAQAMRQIRREFEGEQRVVQLHVCADVLANWRIGRQLQQAIAGLADPQLAGRTQHALAFDAAQLAQLDQKRFSVGTGRQLGTDRRARHTDTCPRIGRTTHDVEQRSRANIHLANAQAVRVGMLRNRLDFADHDAAEWRGNRLERFHFQASHGERIRQLLGAQRGIAKSAQPGFRELHGGEIKSAASGLELGQKADVAIKKQTQIVDAVAQHRQAVRAHAKGKADVFLWIEPHVANHVGVHLA